MKTPLSLFQVIVLAIFGVLAIAGVIYFARGTYGGGSGDVGNVLIWGTLDSRAFSAALRELADEDNRLLNVVYAQRDARTFEADLSDAIASNKGPDLIILSHDYIMKDEGKIEPFSFDVVSERQFRETFVDGASLFLTPKGALGIPISVDPMVLYINRDLLATAGLATSSPATWSSVFNIAEKVTRRDDAKNILKSGVALGEYENITHSKEIISTMIMQAGSPITQRDREGRVRPAIAISSTDVVQPAQSALRYYTEFANPAKIVYSWNRSLPPSRTAFAEGDVGLYIGFASEYFILRAQNPNLNFSVSKLPQISGTTKAITFGRVYAFAVPRGSFNKEGATTVALVLAGKDESRLLSRASGIPSPRRDVLDEPVDGVASVFRDSAVISRGWLDPDPMLSAEIFRGMIEDAIAGAARLSESVVRAERELTKLLGL